MGLLGVPRASARRAQPVHRRDDIEEPGALDVPGADEDLDIRRIGVAGDLGGDRVGQTGIAVCGAEPDQISLQGPPDQLPGQRCGVGRPGIRLHVQPGVGAGAHERVREVGGEPRIRLLQHVPGVTTEQAWRDPWTGCQEDEARHDR